MAARLEFHLICHSLENGLAALVKDQMRTDRQQPPPGRRFGDAVQQARHVPASRDDLFGGKTRSPFSFNRIIVRSHLTCHNSTRLT